MKVRIQEIVNRLFKFGHRRHWRFSAIIIAISYRFLLPDFQYLFLTTYLVATILSIETAIISNFILSNFGLCRSQTQKTINSEEIH